MNLKGNYVESAVNENSLRQQLEQLTEQNVQVIPFELKEQGFLEVDNVSEGITISGPKEIFIIVSN